MAPDAMCLGTLDAVLDEDGIATIDTDDIDNHSTDNCAIVAMDIDITDFNCSQVGQTITVEMNVADASGNDDVGCFSLQQFWCLTIYRLLIFSNAQQLSR